MIPGDHERRAFLDKLRRPAFLLRHAPALTAAVLRRVSTRARLAFAAPHVGLKSRPHWLARPMPLSAAPGDLVARLPDLPMPPPAPRSVYVRTAGSQPDAEDHLRDHRWGFLVELLGTAQGDASVEAALHRAFDWIDAPPSRDDPAWESYSASERVANLLLFLAVRRDLAIDANGQRKLADFVAASAAWIDAHLEYYGAMTNNHLLNNARALTMCGRALGDDVLSAMGINILAHELPRLLLPGGFLRERSSHYQQVVSGWVCDALAFAPLVPGVDLLRAHAGRMAQAHALLRGPRGALLATIGDVSPDVSPEASAWRLASLYPQMQLPLANESRVVDGWFRVQHGDSVLLGNFPPGEFPPAYPTHGHADHGSFTWTHGDVALLADPGRFRYTADPLSAWQCSASGHNLATIDGFAPLCDSLVPGGAWWPRPYADATLTLRAQPRGVVLEHDGTRRCSPVTRVRRELELDGATLTVRERFEGQGEATLRFGWIFGESFQEFDPGERVARGRRGCVRLEIAGLAGIEVAVESRARLSPEYGVALPCVAATIESRVTLPANIITRLRYEPCAA